MRAVALLTTCGPSHYAPSMNEEERQRLIASMRAYADQVGIAPSTLGRLAGNGGDFYARLTAGNRIWPETGRKVTDYMAENPVGDLDGHVEH